VGSESRAYSINNAGQVVGVAVLSPFTPSRAFFFDGATTRDLGTIGGTDSYAFGINNGGQIIMSLLYTRYNR
jgi:probable HAF family extracellular repeat protein